MTEVFVSIGSNIEPEKNIRSSIVDLHKTFGTLRLSPIYQNPAEGFEGNDFLNLAAAFETSLTAQEVDAQLRMIESQHNRDRSQARFAPRTLDIDLLLYGDAVLMKNNKPWLPRKEIARYAFVLKPLTDIAANCKHPVLGKTYQKLWDEFDGNVKLKLIEL